MAGKNQAQISAVRGGPLAHAIMALRLSINGVFQGWDASSMILFSFFLFWFYRVQKKIRKIVWLGGVTSTLKNIGLRWARRIPWIHDKIAAEISKESEKIADSINEHRTGAFTPVHALPDKGHTPDQVLALLKSCHEEEEGNWKDGIVSGGIYANDAALRKLCSDTYALFSLSNPLHADLFYHTARIEAEVVRMVATMFNGDSETVGNITSGGTESICLAMKAYRDWGEATKGITEPNIIISSSAHAAFVKAGQFFKMDVKRVPMLPNGQADVDAIERNINSNTVCIVGSAPQFPQGTLDPIAKLADVAQRNGVGMHVDACLGSFVIAHMEKAGYQLPDFDFRCPGVTSLSCDTHKFGFAPKGTSVIVYRNGDIWTYQFSFCTDWSGGIYATPTVAGSRCGALAVATWAALNYMGVDGYVDATKKIVGAARKIADGINKIDGLKVQGRPDVCVVSMETTAEFNVYAVADALKEIRKWNLNMLQNPAGVHICVTLANYDKADIFLDDLKEAVRMIRAETTDKYQKGGAAMYGMASTVPEDICKDLVTAFLTEVGTVGGKSKTKTKSRALCKEYTA